MVAIANRIAEHIGTRHEAGTTATPPLVELRYKVQGKCDFHVARIRKGVYQIRVGRSEDAIANFRHWPDLMEDTGNCKAWGRLRAALVADGKKDVKFKLEDLECAEDAMFMAERVGVAINSWRMATGRADFPSVTFVALATGLPEPMVKVALREYVQAG